MRTTQRAGAATALLMVFSTLGIFGALPQAARADDVPIIIHKPIIRKDPPKPPKKDGELAVSIGMAVGGQNSEAPPPQ